VARSSARGIPLPERWTPLDPVIPQLRYATSRHRFNVVPAGRRGGKTERAKRKLARAALNVGLLRHRQTPRFFAAAPTQLQAKRIWWRDLNDLLKPWIIKPMVSELTLYLSNGAEVVVTGLDKPERFEGQPWDGGVIDEIANCRPDAWEAHVRPALSTRGRYAWCDLIGVPEGRNFYYDLFRKAQAEMRELGERSTWGAYTWFTSEVLSPEEVASARRDLDPLTFAQEYEAAFVSYVGRAYHGFAESGNVAALRQHYNPRAPLAFCYDFNVSPGVACVVQEIPLGPPPDERIIPRALGRFEAMQAARRGDPEPVYGDQRPVVTGVLGEVWVPDNSTTAIVTQRLITDWGDHQGLIVVYGDASGGARGTTQTIGSDWDIVRSMLYAHFGADRVDFRVPAANGSERARVNAVNSRLCTGDGRRLLLVDGAHARHVVRDLEGVRTVLGGSGEIDKKKDRTMTHISDALGYYVVMEHPTGAPAILETDLTL